MEMMMVLARLMNLRAATLANTFEERYKEGGNGILDTPWLLLPLGPVAT